MFKQGIAASIAAITLMGASATLSAAPISVADNYIGADGGTHGDVVGDPNKFDISSMDIEQSGNDFSFAVNTTFAGEAGIYPDYTNGGTGIGYGDLFLSNNWSPYGTAPYADDNATNGTDWTWGLVLSDRYDNNGGSVSLVKLSGPNADTALLSDDLMSVPASQYRDGQEVVVLNSGTNSEGSPVQSFGTVGTWSLATGQLNINADLGQSDLLGGDSLAFHWGMTCANDVIEGEVDLTKKVPEPGTLGLIALALAGMLIMRRRSNNA